MQILAAVAMVAVLVFVHEFGHFIVAKACRIHVPVFSLGFGRRVLGFKMGGTDYRLSLLPFGGYVKMAGANFNYTEEDDEDGPEDPSTGFMQRPVWQRLLVVAAGPASNLILPVLLFTILLMAGEPQPAAVVGEVERESPAAQAGMQAGDKIVAVGGTEVLTWGEMMEALYPEGATAAPGAVDLVTVERGGQRLELRLTRVEGKPIGIGHSRPGLEIGVDDPRSPAGRAGLLTGDRVLAIEGSEVTDWVDVQQALARRDASVSLQVQGVDGDRREAELKVDPAWTAMGVDLGTADQDWGLLPATLFVGGVSETVDKAPDGAFSGCVPTQPAPPGPAALAGIQPGDRFLSVDGQAVLSWSDVIEGIARSMEGEGDQAKARAVSLELVRQGQVLTVSLTPEVIEDTNSYGHFYFRPILGVTRMGDFVDGPMTRVYYSPPAAVARAGQETVALMGFIVEQLGKLATGEAAMKRSLGGPVEIVRQASHAAEQGLFTYARLAGMLSISLGIVNLLPVPVLDGGQLLFFLVEAVRGRPLSHRLRERAQQIGVLVLVLLMLSVFIFDLQKLFEGGG